MSELKTLKELPSFKEKAEVESFLADKDQFIRGSELRQEAIKWIKLIKLRDASVIQFCCCDDDGWHEELVNWAKHFFNIKDEDLK